MAQRHAKSNKAGAPLVIYVDNLRAFQMWERFRSQMLTVGHGSVVGLNYVPVQHYLDRTAKDDEEWEELFADFQICENAMVDAIGKMKP